MEGGDGAAEDEEEAVTEVLDFVAVAGGGFATDDAVVESDGEGGGGFGEVPHCCEVDYVGEDAH